MKIIFNNSKDYIEFNKSQDGTIQVIISAKDNTNPNSSIVNSCSLTIQQFKDILSSLGI